MECSTKGEKVLQAMKNYKRAKFLYNLAHYSLTSLITCIFFSYYYSWFPSTSHFLPFLPDDISIFLNAKCFFIVGNLIVFFLIGESKLKRTCSSSSSDILYDEYIARSHSSTYIIKSNEINSIGGVMKTPCIDAKKHGHREKIRRRGAKKTEITTVCKSSANMPRDQEKKKVGMRSCKSEVWGESEISHSDQETKKLGMRSSKSEVWGESEIVEMEKTPTEKNEEIYAQGEELNKRVEAFIARVNKQRLLEAKLVDQYCRG